jgi:hypothetical protein
VFPCASSPLGSSLCTCSNSLSSPERREYMYMY